MGAIHAPCMARGQGVGRGGTRPVRGTSSRPAACAAARRQSEVIKVADYKTMCYAASYGVAPAPPAAALVPGLFGQAHQQPQSAGHQVAGVPIQVSKLADDAVPAAPGFQGSRLLWRAGKQPVAQLDGVCMAGQAPGGKGEAEIDVGRGAHTHMCVGGAFIYNLPLCDRPSCRLPAACLLPGASCSFLLQAAVACSTACSARGVPGM